jgi:cytochrome c
MKKSTSLKAVIVFALAGTMFVVSNCNPPEEKQKPSESPGEVMNTGSQAERGRYLVTLAGCDDCHSPKIMTPQGPLTDTTRRLSGYPANSILPAINKAELAPGKWVLGTQDLTAWVGLFGVSFTANLTPDTATGIGAWTPELFIKVIRSGKHMGSESGRPILPPMPWFNYSQMTDDDLNAVFAFLKTLPPVSNKVPEPLPPAL